jgi:GT2 family glycosyltransferase
MHDDVEILAADWVSAMLEFAQLKEVGAVGAKLYNRDGSVANAGVALGVAGIIGHPHRGFRHNSRGYFDWLICTRNCSAVTAACLITRREVIELVGGFDETVGPFYDVDFCLRLRKHNLRVVWTPYAELRYCAGKTEAASDAQAEQLMQTRWGSLLENDPYYNPNLSSRSEDLRIRE